jgi:hypothetical protein
MLDLDKIQKNYTGANFHITYDNEQDALGPATPRKVEIAQIIADGQNIGSLTRSSIAVTKSDQLDQNQVSLSKKLFSERPKDPSPILKQKKFDLNINTKAKRGPSKGRRPKTDRTHLSVQAKEASE